MTIAPVPQASTNFYHPRTSSNHFAREMDALFRLASAPSAHMGNNSMDQNNNLMSGEMDIPCAEGFRPNELNIILNGDALSVRGRHDEPQKNGGFRRHFVDATVVLPEDADRDGIRCGLTANGRHLLIAVPRVDFDAPANSSPPYASATMQGGLW